MESSPSGPVGTEFRAGAWLVRPGECRIVSPAGEAHIRPMLMDLLVLLAGRAGQVVPKDEILDRLRQSRFVSESALTSDIAELRALLGDSHSQPRYIKTVAKRGYCFIAAVKPGPQAAQPRLAVLVFENLNHDPEEDYFAEGMTDALITELGNVRGLRVISRQSVLRFSGSKKSLQEIAGELKVDAVIEGSVLQAGNRVRISVQLIQAEPERHLWAQSRDCERCDVLGVQAQVARTVAEAVQAVLAPKEVVRLSRPQTVNPEAHRAYLKARYHWGKWTREGVQKSLRYVGEAMQAEPGFAPAYSMFAVCMITLGYWGFLPGPSAYRKAKEAACKAVELDESLSEAHDALAWSHWFLDWDPEACEREIQLAIELNPSSEWSRVTQAKFLVTIRRDRQGAREAAKLALDLDPLSVTTNFSVAWVHVFAGAYAEAADQANKALELHPDSPMAYQALGWAYVGQSRYDDAVGAFRKAAALSGDAHSIAALGHACARAGLETEAQALAGELVKRGAREYVPEVCFGILHAGVGDLDHAFERLERCYQERDPHLFWLPVMPAFDPLRTDSRYHDLLQRAGIAP